MILIFVLLVGGACSGRHDPREHVFSLEEELGALAGSGNLWPGFDPMAVPLAVYDGERTYLASRGLPTGAGRGLIRAMRRHHGRIFARAGAARAL